MKEAIIEERSGLGSLTLGAIALLLVILPALILIACFKVEQNRNARPSFSQSEIRFP